jgi:ribosomal-protein-alanine N-acetyltransferase
VGYSVGRAHWNRGLCTEGLRAVLEVAYATHEELNRIHARTDPANAASQRVLEKVGMSREGVLRACRVVDGVAFDEVSFAILRAELKG